MRLLFLAGFTAAALGLSACTAEISETPATEAQASEDAATPKAKQVAFKVGGMT
ncbi:MAG: hypothetical protein ACI8QC_002168 [Planctomycetota bacterium]|jgi:hypothetical protein